MMTTAAAVHASVVSPDTVDATRVLPPLPPPPTAPTMVIRDTAPAEDAKDQPARTPAKPGARRRLTAIIAGAALAVAAVVVAVIVWNGIASAPAAPPDLPQVEEPLGTHLHDLMDEVSP